MFDRKKIKDLILVSLVSDSYSLGSHWVYDEVGLKNPSIDWEILNTPMALWHKGKSTGEFTHFGDQYVWLYEYLQEVDNFDSQEYFKYWLENMQKYNGYIDGATRQTLENVKENKDDFASDSTDLSIIGRIIPLLLVSKDCNEFLKNAEDFVKLTHNNQKTISVTKFFVKLICKVFETKDIEKSIVDLKDEFDSHIQDMIKKGVDSKNRDTFETIREFGPACDIDEGFSGVIHLLCKYKDFKQLLIQNAKAGGDTSARAMIAGVIVMINQSNSVIPTDWLKIRVQV